MCFKFIRFCSLFGRFAVGVWNVCWSMYIGHIASHFRTVEVCDVCMIDVYIACVAEFAHNMFAGFVHCFGQVQLPYVFSTNQYQL